MALYAFDGTSNQNKPGDKDDTNVRKFYEAYPGEEGKDKFYIEGVGVERTWAERIAGYFGGYGGHKRVKEAKTWLIARRAAGDRVIDVVGFSRGAALALEFANEVADSKLGEIRFLGLWDTVGSFGIPGNDFDPGYHFVVPGNVKRCYHAMALDEKRQGFELHRLETRVENVLTDSRLIEAWFAGVHSDVGGGNGKNGLRSVSLCWMMRRAEQAGLPMDKARFAEFQKWIDLKEQDYPNWNGMLEHDRYRTLRWNDQVHWSVVQRATDQLRAQKQWVKNTPPMHLTIVNDDGDVVGDYPKLAPRAKYAPPEPAAAKR